MKNEGVTAVRSHFDKVVPQNNAVHSLPLGEGGAVLRLGAAP